jgi:hypothetical protein
MGIGRKCRTLFPIFLWSKKSGLVNLTALSFVLLLTDFASVALDADADAGGYDAWCQFAGRVSCPS